MFNVSTYKNVFLIYTLSVLSCFAQSKNDKTIHLDSLGNETSLKNYKYSRVIKDYNIEKTEYKVYDYNQSKNLVSYGVYRDKDAKILNGISIKFHENGMKKHSQMYENAMLISNDTIWNEDGSIKMIGEYFKDEENNEIKHKILEYWNEDYEHVVKKGSGIVTFNEDNVICSGAIINGLKSGKWIGNFTDTDDTFSEMYFDGNFISGVRKDYNDKETLYREIEEKARPINGINDLKEYISQNLVYTTDAITNKASGKIILKLSISAIGQVTDKTIVQGIGYGMDEKSMKLILNYPGWLPAEKRGTTMNGEILIPIDIEQKQ